MRILGRHVLQEKRQLMCRYTSCIPYLTHRVLVVSKHNHPDVETLIPGLVPQPKRMQQIRWTSYQASSVINQGTVEFLPNTQMSCYFPAVCICTYLG